MDNEPLDRSQSVHRLTRTEALAWLAGSSVLTILIHRTDPVSADEIQRSGATIRLTEPEPAWGYGFYASTRANPRFGEAEVRVAIRPLNPLALPDPVDGAEVIDGLLVRTGTDDTRNAVLAAGHDGLVLHLGRDELWVVAYQAAQVRVITDWD